MKEVDLYATLSLPSAFSFTVTDYNWNNGNDGSGPRYFNYKKDETGHVEIAAEIVDKVKPLAYFQNYLHHGFAPFFLEKRNFSENLLKTMNMMLEVDVLFIKQIELKYLPKIRKLLYLIASTAPCVPNVSQLSTEINISRATVMNYIKYLSEARLFNLLYAEGDEFPKKPAMVYMKAIREAEAYPGPSLIIAYSPCINHGLKAGMGKAQAEEERAVECGYWHLWRYNPQLEEEGKNPFLLDSKEPQWEKFQDFLKGEVRYTSLLKQYPAEAAELFQAAEDNAKWRYKGYKRLASAATAE